MAPRQPAQVHTDEVLLAVAQHLAAATAAGHDQLLGHTVGGVVGGLVHPQPSRCCPLAYAMVAATHAAPTPAVTGGAQV